METSTVQWRTATIPEFWNGSPNSLNLDIVSEVFPPGSLHVAQSQSKIDSKSISEHILVKIVSEHSCRISPPNSCRIFVEILLHCCLFLESSSSKSFFSCSPSRTAPTYLGEGLKATFSDYRFDIERPQFCREYLADHCLGTKKKLFPVERLEVAAFVFFQAHMNSRRSESSQVFSKHFGEQRFCPCPTVCSGF